MINCKQSCFRCAVCMRCFRRGHSGVTNTTCQRSRTCACVVFGFGENHSRRRTTLLVFGPLPILFFDSSGCEFNLVLVRVCSFRQRTQRRRLLRMWVREWGKERGKGARVERAESARVRKGSEATSKFLFWYPHSISVRPSSRFFRLNVTLKSFLSLPQPPLLWELLLHWQKPY